MRALVLIAFIFGLLPVVLFDAHIGILVYHWLSLMNPHQLVWGFSEDLRFVLIVAGVTLVAWLLGSERKRIPWTPPVLIILLLLLWMSLTTLFALSPSRAYLKWELTTKILFMALVTIALMQSRTRLHALAWIIVGSIGYYGVKGGAFAIATGGMYRVVGPENSFIGDNNAIALALNMALPLMWYLRGHSRNTSVRHGLLLAMLLTVIAILATYSRGGLLGLGVVLAAMLFRSRHRFALGLLLAVTAAGILPFLPQQWYDRTASIGEYDADRSFQGRVDMWRMAVDIARDRPIQGGGFSVFKEPGVYPRYNPDADKVRDVHSIYFEMLGEHGIVGLILFLALGFAALWQTIQIRRIARGHAHLTWAHDLASMIQISMAGYAVSGAFLTLATFDLYYLLVAVIAALRETIAQAIEPVPSSPARHQAPTTVRAAAQVPTVGIKSQR